MNTTSTKQQIAELLNSNAILAYSSKEHAGRTRNNNDLHTVQQHFNELSTQEQTRPNTINSKTRPTGSYGRSKKENSIIKHGDFDDFKEFNDREDEGEILLTTGTGNDEPQKPIIPHRQYLYINLDTISEKAESNSSAISKEDLVHLKDCARIKPATKVHRHIYRRGDKFDMTVGEQQKGNKKSSATKKANKVKGVNFVKKLLERLSKPKKTDEALKQFQNQRIEYAERVYNKGLERILKEKPQSYMERAVHGVR